MSMLVNLLIIFGLNVFSTCLGNLKSNFLAMKAIKQVYVITFLDALVFVYAFRLITASDGYAFVLCFALGRLCGVFLANKIEKNMAVGLIEIDVYKHLEPGKLLADNLREQGYSVTTTLGYGKEGKPRLVLTTVLPRRQFPAFRSIIEQDGSVNMAIKTVSKAYGKVGDFSMLAG